MASKYGVRIKNIKAGTLYGYNIGVRDRYEYKNAMFTNSLFLDFLLENGLKVNKNGSTKDIICIDFDFGLRDYDEEYTHIQKQKEKDKDNPEKYAKLEIIESKIIENKEKYIKISKEDIRDEFYESGVEVEYIYINKSGELKSKETIKYRMLYRSTGKAKNGSCIFICDRLYKKAYKYLYMGIQLPKENAPLVEISGYIPLVASTIVDRIRINPNNILILKDVDSFFETNVVSVETDEEKHLIAKTIEKYKLKNTLFDGQGLIDSSIFPEWGDGYVLLRQHMCKMACFKSFIQLFFMDYFGDSYETAEVEDMFGNKHLAKDIKLITTDNAMKWLKFGISYEYWCEKVLDNGGLFGVVKTAHQSKLGEVQKMSYQMINALDLDIMEDVTRKSKEYVESMKRDNLVFLDYLRMNYNFSNDYEVLVALCEQNMDFTRSVYFRDRKKFIIKSYIDKLKFGKIIQDADNLVIVGSPYAMLLHSVGEDVNKDDTFSKELGLIQCYTNRFSDGEYLAEFRSPFNSKNNMGYLHNVYHEKLLRYFDFGKQIIAVNMINTDFQDRNNGSDMDSDSIYTTNQTNIVDYAKYCYSHYPTIVNNIPKESKQYSNNMKSYSTIDNSISRSRMAIGESSNVAQLALTYSYNFKDQKYIDYVCILSVLAQVAIDSAKRRFDIDIAKELNTIKADMDIKDNGYPIFWKHIKDSKVKEKKNKFKMEKINRNLKCPMNYISEIKFEDSRSDESTLPMSYFFKKVDIDENRRKSKKVESLIESYSFDLYNSISENTEEDEYFLLRADFEDMIEEMKTTYLSSQYLGLMSWLINRAFCIGDGVKRNNKKIQSKTESNKSILLSVLYGINPSCLLEIFSKNAQNLHT